jgi:uncharacterized protein YkwD
VDRGPDASMEGEQSLPPRIAPLVAGFLLLAAAATNSVGGGAQDSTAFLDVHNTARADVGVAPLVWDVTVASYARQYAAARQGNCALQHSGVPYGENIFWGSASAGASWSAADAVAPGSRRSSTLQQNGVFSSVLLNFNEYIIIFVGMDK